MGTDKKMGRPARIMDFLMLLADKQVGFIYLYKMVALHFRIIGGLGLQALHICEAAS